MVVPSEIEPKCSLKEKLKEKLAKLKEHEPVLSSVDLATEWAVDHEQISAAVRSLDSKEGFLNLIIEKRIGYIITDTGKAVIEKGDPGYSLFYKLPQESNVEKKSFLVENGFSDQDFNAAVKNKWITMTKDANKNLLIMRSPNAKPKNLIKEKLSKFMENNYSISGDDLKMLNKAKFLDTIKTTDFKFRPGPNFTLKDVEEKLELTIEDLTDNKWKNFTFRKYNLEALGNQSAFGSLHPLMKMKEEISTTLTQMGFNEMPTNQYVENSFWNFDSLFVQQNHPARDDQDTFFIKDSAARNDIPDDLFTKVSNAHKSAFGTHCSHDESEKKVLRTHTTATTARILSKFAKAYADGTGPKSAKYFSIDKVFRNETLDATHLAEFHQIEGWVADESLSLANLMGTLKEFYVRLDIDQLKFKSTFNPYTEPSLEVHGYHKEMKKWIEIGNSGMFRPEMLEALGLDPKIKVMAWGLSLERPTMIKHGIKNIRELYGNKVDLEMVQNSGICLLE